MKVAVAMLYIAHSLCVSSLALDQVLFQRRLHILKAEVNALQQLIERDCPMDQVKGSGGQEVGRDLYADDNPAHLEVQELTYRLLFDKLMECRNAKNQTIDNKNSTLRNDSLPTTAQLPGNLSRPIECQQAVNYTQSWRLDQSGSDLQPGGLHSYKGYACDFGANSLNWFRLSGPAGNKILNTCPPIKSCGTLYPLWSDDVPPQRVGVKQTIYVYQVSFNECRAEKYPLQVIRCSEHDFIYKHVHVSSPLSNFVCANAFCAMV